MTKIYTDSLYWKDIVRASLCKYLILRALTDEPLHGYALIYKIAEQTKEFFRPTQGISHISSTVIMNAGCDRNAPNPASLSADRSISPSFPIADPLPVPARNAAHSAAGGTTLPRHRLLPHLR